MADNVNITAGTGTVIATDQVGTDHYQRVKLTDGTADSSTVIAADVGAKANALRVAPANDITDATYIGDIKFGEALPAGTAAIGKLAANTGVDIGDVDILSIAAGDNNIGNVDIVTVPAPLSVVGTGTEAAAMRVTIATDSTGVLSVDDNGGTLTVDGTVTANLSATDNAVLDTIDAVLDTINAKLVTGTVIGDVNLGATDNAVLDVIAADTTSIDEKITACNTGAVVLDTGTASIGKLATNTGVDIGDVDVTSIVPGTAATNLGKAEDNAHSSGDVGVMSLVVRKDAAGTLGGTDGDYVPLQVDADGSLRVTGAGGGTQYAEDAVHASGNTGTFALVVRQDTAAQLAGSDGDYSGLVNDANGRLHVISSSRAKSVEAITDWTAVAQNTIGESGTINCSTHDGTSLLIQAFLDSTTAHTGTRFIVQVSSNTTGDEDWHDYREFVNLIGTAKTDAIENNPLNAGETSLTLTSHLLTVNGVWKAIENGTLINSELFFQASQSTDAIVALDGVTNAHAQGTAVFNIAMSKTVILDATVNRARVLIDNTYDNDGSTLNYKVRAVKLTR